MSARDTSGRTSTVCRVKPLFGVAGSLKGELEMAGDERKSTVKPAIDSVDSNIAVV
jgi:hypothetical protein